MKWELALKLLFINNIILHTEARPSFLHPDSIRAVANIEGKVTGRITLERTNFGFTLITGELKGLSSNKSHGFHIHEHGDLARDCKAAGGHYNPMKKNHGGPLDGERHVGDLGNIHSDVMGNEKVMIVDRHVKLTGRYTVIGRSIVIHQLPDDLGKGGNKGSLATGNAGPRIGCGIIEKLS